MTPLTVNPTVVVLVDDKGNVTGISSNVAPDLKVQVVKTGVDFLNESKNKPFVTTRITDA